MATPHRKRLEANNKAKAKDRAELLASIDPGTLELKGNVKETLKTVQKPTTKATAKPE